mmetsp:Transcript_17769/g.53313  ORF Transcript_17769/g.53313 Transcript_17769/m.53313 type:complete len:234 (+) Transcript_17769:1443-2144(+)
MQRTEVGRGRVAAHLLQDAQQQLDAERLGRASRECHVVHERVVQRNQVVGAHKAGPAIQQQVEQPVAQLKVEAAERLSIVEAAVERRHGEAIAPVCAPGTRREAHVHRIAVDHQRLEGGSLEGAGLHLVLIVQVEGDARHKVRAHLGAWIGPDHQLAGTRDVHGEALVFVGRVRMGALHHLGGRWHLHRVAQVQDALLGERLREEHRRAQLRDRGATRTRFTLADTHAQRERP